MIDALTRQLFGQFPREFAIPSRSMVYDIVDFNQRVTINDGIFDCYTSIFPFGDKGIIVDKIFLDFDKTDFCDGDTTLNDAKRVYRHMVDKGHIVVPVASGKKGIHLYILLKPIDYIEQEGKTALYQATIQMLEDVFGPLEQGTEYTDDDKSVYVYYAVDEDRRILGVDPKIVGDIRRITRVPHTRRPPANKSWCTYLPPSFVDASWLDIINWCKMPHYMDRVDTPKFTLADLPKSDRKIENTPISKFPEAPIPVEGNALLSAILRPCLYHGITRRNPRHDARVAATIDLLRDWSPNEITQIYSTLNWMDWNSNVTRAQILTCQKYKPYSCKKLRGLGLCIVDIPEECPINSVLPMVIGSAE